MSPSMHDPAFPESRLHDDPGGIGVGLTHYPGISKLEYFAGLAMQGMWANGESIQALLKITDSLGQASTRINGPQLIAALALNSAKALLAELEKELASPDETRSGAV